MSKPIQEYTQVIIVRLLIECIDTYNDGAITKNILYERANAILDNCKSWWLFEPSGEYRMYVWQRLGKRRMKCLEEIMGGKDELSK